MRFGIKRPLAAGLALAAVGLAALRARARRRQLPRRRAAEHDPARHRRRHRVQPGAARRDERRRAGGGGARLGRRQHVVHDGRRARPRGAREPRRVAHRQPARRAATARSRRSSAATTLAFLVGAVFAVAAAAIGRGSCARAWRRPSSTGSSKGRRQSGSSSAGRPRRARTTRSPPDGQRIGPMAERAGIASSRRLDR